MDTLAGSCLVKAGTNPANWVNWLLVKSRDFGVRFPYLLRTPRNVTSGLGNVKSYYRVQIY